jgi:hypothetical protein
MAHQYTSNMNVDRSERVIGGIAFLIFQTLLTGACVYFGMDFYPYGITAVGAISISVILMKKYKTGMPSFCSLWWVMYVCSIGIKLPG